MKIKILLLFIALFSALPGMDIPASWGITAWPADTVNFRITSNHAMENHSAIQFRKGLSKPAEKIRGYVRQSISFNQWIDPQDYIVCHYNSLTHSIELLKTTSENQLIQQSLEAIDKAPAWLTNPLFYTLSKLDSIHQHRWSTVILESENPYIDEIAFCVAYSSAAFLKSKYSFPELFTENAATLYANDTDLDYVEIVDYGSNSENFYSTTRYQMVQKVTTPVGFAYDTVDVEIPHLTYYWYIVHPKISDEIPAYINPSALEYSHRDNIDRNGHFWRTYFFNHNDEGYANLKALLKNIKVAWDNGFGAAPANAVQRLNVWIGNSMPEFGSNNERPHQPVRIYAKHLGRCGEFSDIRSAAARTALIPCTNVGSLSTDHVWNEFFLGRWVHWDNDIDSPQMYENGWSKVFGSVYERRSDGKITTITSRYSDICQIDLTVTDNIGKAVDGAVVRLYMYNDDLYPNYLQRSDNYGLTDSEGKITFKVGENRKYYVRVESNIGTFPSAGEMELLISQTQKYTNYSFTLPINNPIDTTVYDNTAIQNNKARYYLNLNLDIPDEIINGPVWFDDIGNDAQFFYQSMNKEEIEVFMVNDLSELEDKANVSAINRTSGQFLNNLTFPVNETEDQYLVIANFNNRVNLQNVVCQIELIDTKTNNPENITLQQNYPNPFNHLTKIPFTLQETAQVTVDIFNILGQKIRTLKTVSGEKENNYVTWDGKNDDGAIMPSGIYLYRLKGIQNQFKQMVLMK
ncbi:MAG: T9SS type A sorting domain-containing protein [Candidatus Marinimicrobia bacterium]|nr:T9SS type A sorting domain-containing protein [Candidatus Neomarinimicrobiota bacterium]